MQQDAAVGVRVGAHAPVGLRRQRLQLRHEPAVLVEELLRPVAPQPLLELREPPGLGAHVGQRHLVGAEGALDRQAVDHLGAGPALGRAQDDHRPAHGGRRLVLEGPAARSFAAGPALDLVDLAHDLVEHGRELAMHGHRLVAADEVDAVAVALEQHRELVLRDAREQRRIGDLVAVQVQDRQHRSVARRVEELVRVPARRERTGLGLPVADHAGDEQAVVVERRPVGVRERVPELAALVDGAGRLGRHVAGDAARERELAEEPAQAVRVAAHLRIDLAVGALEVRVGDERRAAVARPGHEHRVQVPQADRPVEVRVDEVEAGGRAPVPEQPGLDVLGPQRLPQQRVVHQVDLTDGEVVRGSPVRVEQREVLFRKRGHEALRMSGGPFWDTRPRDGHAVAHPACNSHACR